MKTDSKSKEPNKMTKEAAATPSKLITALLEFHKAFNGVVKKGLNPQFKSKYATITDILDAVIEPLAEQGLVLVQTEEPETLSFQPPDGGREERPGRMLLITRLFHVDGDEIRSSRAIPDALWTGATNKAQAYQSAITYARRGAISALLSIPQYDDDAQAAQETLRDGAKTTTAKPLTQAEIVATTPHRWPTKDDKAKIAEFNRQKEVAATKAAANAAKKPEPYIDAGDALDPMAGTGY